MILVSGGHYPDQKGAVHEEFSEFPITYDWARHTVDIIERVFKTPAVLVPTGTLGGKIRFVNEVVRSLKPHGQPVIACEIHFNSAPGALPGKVSGSETLYFPGSVKGKELATLAQKHISQVFGPDRGAIEGWLRRDKPGVVDYQGDVDGDEEIAGFLKFTHCPAIIVEPDFIQNVRAFLPRREMFCQSLAKALVEFIA